MYANNKIGCKEFWSFSFFIVTTIFYSGWAQSGRVVPAPVPPPAAMSPAPSPPSKFLPDPNADKYRLVIPLSYQGKGAHLPLEEVGYQEDRSINNNYISEMNKVGAQGYKLVSSLINHTALFKLDNVQYEYAWFMTYSHVFFAKQGFEEAYASLSKQGYSLSENIFLHGSCEEPAYKPGSNDTPIPIKECEFQDLFLLARVTNEKTPQQYRLAQHTPRWKELSGDSTLTEQVRSSLADGFVPTQIFSKYEILLQRLPREAAWLHQKADIQVITGNVQKKVTELAQQGYRLLLVNYEIALVTREKESAAPVAYVWLDVTKKNFRQQLAQLQAQGARYLLPYPIKYGDKCTLIFEQPLTPGNIWWEYKTLNFIKEEMPHKAEERTDFAWSATSRENLKIMQQLVKEGFEARTLFDPDKSRNGNATVLLEREHQGQFKPQIK
jgi:hypothetical protein